MNQIDRLKEKFNRIGARLVVTEVTNPRWYEGDTGFLIDILRDRKGEYFDLRLLPKAGKFAVIDFRPKDRHLLLMVTADPNTVSDRDHRRAKFLCGHDERHWFVAGVHPHARDVAHAKQSLKPAVVHKSEIRKGVKTKKLHRHKNEAWVRQGEWFFVPASGLDPDPMKIVRPEPLRRGGGKSHIADEGHHRGGEQVYVCDRYPNGLTEFEYADLLARKPEAKSWRWTVMTRNATVYVRGCVRHPDHATIVLNDWHAVLPNAEVQYKIAGLNPQAFLD